MVNFCLMFLSFSFWGFFHFFTGGKKIYLTLTLFSIFSHFHFCIFICLFVHSFISSVFLIILLSFIITTTTVITTFYL